jgi:hypothetical protein
MLCLLIKIIPSLLYRINQLWEEITVAIKNESVDPNVVGRCAWHIEKAVITKEFALNNCHLSLSKTLNNLWGQCLVNVSFSFLFVFLMGLGFELKTSCLQSMCSIA